MGEQCFCVANKEVELLRWQLLNHQGAYHNDVTAAFNDQLIGQATVECAENKATNENILYGPVSSTFLLMQITGVCRQPALAMTDLVRME